MDERVGWEGGGEEWKKPPKNSFNMRSAVIALRVVFSYLYGLPKPDDGTSDDDDGRQCNAMQCKCTGDEERQSNAERKRKKTGKLIKKGI